MQHQDVSVHCGAAYPAVQAHDSSRNQEVIQYLPYLHCESKKQDTKLLAITSLTIIRFSKIFSLADSVVNLQQIHV